MGKTRNILILVREHEGKVSLETPGSRWKNTIKMCFWCIESADVGWIQLAAGQVAVEGSCEHGNEL
jgi:hypothetical protein